jgi:hypothetical protein
MFSESDTLAYYNQSIKHNQKSFIRLVPSQLLSHISDHFRRAVRQSHLLDNTKLAKDFTNCLTVTLGNASPTWKVPP